MEDIYYQTRSRHRSGFCRSYIIIDNLSQSLIKGEFSLHVGFYHTHHPKTLEFLIYHQKLQYGICGTDQCWACVGRYRVAGVITPMC